MKKILTLTAAAALLAGCASTQNDVKMPPTKIVAGAPAAAGSDEVAQLAATQSSLEAQMIVVKRSLDEAKRSLDEASKESERLEKRSNEERDALLETAKHIKTIKDQIDVLVAQQTANQASIMQIDQTVKIRTQDLKRMQDELAATPKQIGELQSLYLNEKKQRAAESEAAKKVAADLEREKQQRAADAELTRKNAEDMIKRQQAELAAAKAAAKPAPAPAVVTPAIAATPAVTPPPAAQPAPPSASDDLNKMVAQGNSLLAAGKAAEASKLFEAAIKARPTMGTALVGLAACQYQLGDSISSARTADRALDLNPLDAQALGVKGLLYRRSGDFSTASATLEKAVKSDPNDARLHNYLAITYSDRKRNADAIEQFRKATELDPAYAEAHFNLAFLLATATPPKLDEARTHYAKAVSLGAERDADLDKLLGPAGDGAAK